MRNLRSPIALFLAAGLLAGSPKAQELEEIVVTAERRSENLQDVPNAITALSRLTIEQADIHDLTDIATRVPGLTFSPFSPGQNVVALRGASSNDDGAGTDNSVAVFVDDVYLGRVSNINPEMFDLERVEVLRGPQGTLYGKNTIGGAINVVSTRPNTDEVEGRVRLNVGNYARRDLAGLITGPVGNGWAGKASFSYRKRDGWVDNVFLRKKQKDDDVKAFRGQLLYAGEDFEALLSADFNQLDVEDMARTPIATGEPGDPAFWAAPVPGSYADLCAGRGADCSAGPIDGYAKRDAWGLSGKLNWSRENGELISITAYRENEADWNMDSTGTPVSPLPPLFNQINDDIFDVTDQLTQEFRWVSSIGDNIDYVAGLWYLREETDRTECFDNDVTASDCTPTADNGATDWYRQVNRTTSYAAFGQFDWTFTDAWELTVGGRYSADKKEIDNDAVAGDFVVINQNFSNSVSENWSAFTPKLSLAWLPNDDTTVYGAVSWGFKSGGFAAAPQGIEFTEPLAQEEAVNYELGVKADLAGAFRLNAALFYTEYQDLQMQTFGPLTAAAAFGTFQTFNAGDATIQGIELEATWVVNERWTLSGFYAFQDSEFGDTNIPGTAWPDQSGQELIRAPENKFNINADYNLALANGSELAANLSWRYTDDQRGELEPWSIQPAFDLLDARLSWTRSDGALELALWGKNLADEEYISHLYAIASSVVAVFGDPRMYGATLTYRF
ncbi:MAG: TonB-dependent receptor [Gammaproteobacteria bacterium]|nr:TonB-dependent receptor [Gammaproteobacteria bacterium]